jgi:hypothetical protein
MKLTVNPETIDYRAPFVVTTIFKSQSQGAQKEEEYDPILARARGEETGPREYSATLMADWKDIIGIQSYPYSEESIWEKFSDSPKFYLILLHQGSFLVEGNIEDWMAYWAYYKTH